MLVALVALGFDAFAVQAPNPRGSSSAPTSTARSTDSANVSRVAVGRSAVRSPARGAIVSTVTRGGATVARGASGTVARGSTARTGVSPHSARSAIAIDTSRAGTARATKVYSDISKIGGGYATCRESYATCMDQFCANANDTYRRCYCSSRFTEFRNTENALDEAKTLLMRFEDNNLNAVDKSAAEVNAMYTATVGEAAIKNDTSAAAKMLDEISDLLSGKKKTTYSSGLSSTSLGVLSFDFSTDIDDIWSDGGNSIFSTGLNSQNLSELEGVSLYNAANKQCTDIMSGDCESSAVFNMARSSYSIMITQDCNAYQANVDKKVESVKQAVRTAEKYLREARLAEYHSHNNANVNECITKVRTALTADTACGANYKRCLDYTGAYINQTTGDAIYSPRLFQLTDLIKLSGVTDGKSDMDVLAQNPKFNDFLESRKIFANAALDTCRDIASTVWNEFKRTALIEIAQAQDEKIEEVKMSCVSTMADCYDTQSSALKSFDDTTAQMAGAISAYAARQMCVDKVSACAALYGNDTPCQFNNDGKLANASSCGLTALLKFVDTVDTVRITEGCETALQNYAKELCTPTSGTIGYPWNCRLMSAKEIQNNLTTMAGTYCDLGSNANMSVNTETIIDALVSDISMQLADAMMDQCQALGGLWIEGNGFIPNNYNELKVYYSTVYGNNQTYVENSRLYGRCIESTTRVLCEAYNTDNDTKTTLTTYDALRDTCNFSQAWYEKKCTEELGGVWENSTCYITEE